MHLIFCALLVTLARTQETTTIENSIIIGIFGTPPPASTNGTQLEDITVKPTESSVTFTNKNGESCQCVPYYLCDQNNVAVDANNSTVTGWGLLDIRFGDGSDRTCQETVEICCTAPKDEKEVPRPKPDPSKLRGCGYRNPNGIDGFTVTGGSGAEAQYAEFPWVVALLDNLNGSSPGVGVLIHPQVVMTAAHIAYKYALGTMKVRAGEWDTQTVKEIFDYQERGIQEIYIHSDFNNQSLANDVALLRLQQPLQLGEHINMICLPGQDESFDSSRNCVSNGWGKDKFGLQGRYAVILKRVEQNMVSHERCNMLLKRTRLGNRFNLHRSFVCAGGEEGIDTCQGDGGAPLACPIGDNRYKLTGLVAWGIGCGMKDVPAVFASVPAFRNWVDAKMNEWGYGTSTYAI